MRRFSEGMREILKSVALGMLNLWHPKTALAAFRGRNSSKAFHSAKITLLCFMVTVLVLRGSVGVGKLDPQPQDSEVTHRMKRILGEGSAERNSSQEVYRMGPRILDWDEQRAPWLHRNPHPIESPHHPSILLVSGSQPQECDNPKGDHYLLKAIKNKMDYCRLHGIRILYNLANLDPELSGFWSKLPLLRTLMLAHPEVEWLWWMDSDAMFTDMLFELPMAKYASHNLVLHGWERDVYEKRRWVGVNTGSFLIRNCQWSLDLLDMWAPFGPKGVRKQMGELLTRALAERPAFEADDQSALVYLLVTRRAELESKVFLENSFYLHGYWVILVDRFEEMMGQFRPGLGDERWPFVTHFVGCKPCRGSEAEYSAARCFREMERAFNFADNQVIQKYGMCHVALGSSNVVRTGNDTSRPPDAP